MKFDRRLKYELFGALVLVLGLAIFWAGPYLPLFMRNYVGDILVASLIYLVFAVLFINKSAFFISVFTLIFTFSIELLQLVQLDCIDKIRQTTFGKLTLGSTFDFFDLICYFLGISITLFFDLLFLRPKASK